MSEKKINLKSNMTVTELEPPLPSASKLIWIVCVGLLVLLVWAWFFKLEEVSTGTGKVVPTSKEQIVQSLDGGILTKIHVKEGQIVNRGQTLAQLDPTRFESNVGETASLLMSSKATAARLRAEVSGTPLSFPAEVLKETKLVAEETALYNSRRANLEESLAGLQQALSLVKQELSMTEPLVAKGAASDVEVLRLKREANDLLNQMNDIKNQYHVKAREELAKANTDIETQQQVVKGKSDTLSRTVFK